MATRGDYDAMAAFDLGLISGCLTSQPGFTLKSADGVELSIDVEINGREYTLAITHAQTT